MFALHFLPHSFSGAVVLWRKGAVQKQQLKCLASFQFLFPTVAVSMCWLGQTDYTHCRPNSYFSIEHPRIRLRHLRLDINLACPCYCTWRPHLSPLLLKMNISQPEVQQNYWVWMQTAVTRYTIWVPVIWQSKVSSNFITPQIHTLHCYSWLTDVHLTLA